MKSLFEWPHLEKMVDSSRDSDHVLSGAVNAGDEVAVGVLVFAMLLVVLQVPGPDALVIGDRVDELMTLVQTESSDPVVMAEQDIYHRLLLHTPDLYTLVPTA